MKKILLSAVGSTDPIRTDYDGPLLHCIRNLRPDKVYLFYSKEMFDRDKDDEKVVKAIEILAQDLGIDIEIVIENTGLVEVHIIEEVAPHMKKFFRRVISENPDCEYLVNLTSGTAQISASMRLLCVNGSSPMKTYEVENPERKANHSETVKQEDKVNELVANNFDDLENSRRCFERDMTEFRRNFLMSNAVKLIKSYHYNSAMELLNNDPQKSFSDDEEFMKLLRFACERYNQNYAYVNTNKKNVEIKIPVTKDEVMRMFEYYLKMRSLFSQKEYVAATLQLSPLLCKLMERYLYLTYRLDIRKCVNIEGRFDEDFCRQSYPEYSDVFDSVFRHTSEMYLKASTLIGFADALSKTRTGEPDMQYVDLISELEKLRVVEEKIRNRMAHEIAYIDENRFKKECSMSVEDVVALIEKTVVALYRNDIKSETYFSSYDDMNEALLAKLEDIL